MKKLMICFLTGLLLLGVTACGKTTAAGDVTLKLKNSVFMGDSITEGFVVNEILPQDSVIAGAGATAGFAYDDMGALTAKKPARVFIMLGSNDLLMPVAGPQELFRQDLRKLIKKIKEELPASAIYLQSITPVTREALQQEPRYAGIGEYNGILQELAGKLAVHYVDIGALAEANPALFAEDGVHFRKEFYQLWLQKLSESL
ncbi:GDSL-type esterase/lipase family protein [Desulfosporosinus sp. PR]|uniref:GDSL-type esterase/lipase family protein n=1 Tax=Candidatus Desulfosporosinus nitrosoreducens TaxID=3401928 RepID=UPI0027F177BF|nr:GDSL-type esterase/lipase family protein [Desulfosporosinus sp. PR]MDQ7095745.1 GDSL-type esterase/lipase family protein [Desulfosporosinus sp. PR]